MAGRTSARSSVNRDLASSPPKKGGRREQGPVTRVTRSTRSQSRELSGSDTNTSTQRNARTRGSRQESVDNVDSNTSVENKGRRRRKRVRDTVAVARDLSIVAEASEAELSDEGKDDVADAEDTENAQNVDEKYQPLLSPGGMSSISGTTALTSHSAQEMADLDSEMIVKLMPSLFRDTSQLLDLLLPTDVTPLKVESIVKELQVPGSSRGKMLRYIEETFDITRKNFGSDLFINPSFILRKLFDQSPGIGDFRPEIVLHAANIATLVKRLLILQRDNPNTMALLQQLDDLFPSPFLSRFETVSQYGTSALAHVSFDFALELRTQTSISILKANPNYDPDQLITQMFYEPPAQRDPILSTYEDSVLNGEFRKISGSADSWPNSEAVSSAQSGKIRERVEEIRESFYSEQQAIEDGDYVDFDHLHNKFPWSNFLADAIKWSQSRMEEIQRCLELQGGIYNMATTLVEEIQNLNSQIELNYEPPRAIKTTNKTISPLLPAAAIIPATSGKSLYKSSKSVEALFRTRSAVSKPLSNQQQPGALTESIISLPKSVPSTGLKKLDNQGVPDTEHARTGVKSSHWPEDPFLDESEPLVAGDLFQQGTRERSTRELLADLHEAEGYQNKENQPLLQSKDATNPRRRFVDRQPNAQRVAWSQISDDDVVELSPSRGKKRNYRALSNDLDTSEDEGFQNDSRILDIPRRRLEELTTGPTTGKSGVDPRSPHKRVRVQSPSESESERRRRASNRREERMSPLEQEDQDPDTRNEFLSEDAVLQASARAGTGTDDEEVLPTSTPAPSYAVISETAKALRRQKPLGVSRKVQQRTPWSEKDTELLIKRIGEIGCSWSAIEEKGGFEHTRDQVALKDKARNIKVDFLRAGVDFLPEGFDGVSLGKKERDKVRAVEENPFRKEGERPGGECEGPESPR